MNTFRPTGGKDRHLKVKTSKGTRDRRIRLSASVAIQLYDIQDRLGYNQPSMAVEWLIKNAQQAINELAPLPSIVADEGVSCQSHPDMSAAETRLRHSVEQLSRSNSSLDHTRSNTGTSLLQKDNYDSGFMESSSRTVDHVLSDKRHHHLDKTSTMKEECAPVRLLEQRFSVDLPSGTISEASDEREKLIYNATMKTDSRTRARERARSAKETVAKVRSSLKIPLQKDVIMSSGSSPARTIFSHSSPADNIQLSCSAPVQAEIFRSSHPKVRGPADKRAHSGSLQSTTAQVSPLIATELILQNRLSNISEDFWPKVGSQLITSSNCPSANTVHFLRSAPTLGTPSDKSIEFLFKGSLEHHTRPQIWRNMRIGTSLGCQQTTGLSFVSSSSGNVNVHGLTSPFLVSHNIQAPHFRHVYPYLSTSGYPIFEGITANQLSSSQCLPISSNSPQHRPPDHFSPRDELTSGSMQASCNTSTSTSYSSQAKGQDCTDSWHGWTFTSGQGFTANSSSACSSTTLSEEQRFANRDPAVHEFSDTDHRTLSQLHPRAVSERSQNHEGERTSNLPSNRITFRSLIEETETLDEVFDTADL